MPYISTRIWATATILSSLFLSCPYRCRSPRIKSATTRYQARGVFHGRVETTTLNTRGALIAHYCRDKEICQHRSRLKRCGSSIQLRPTVAYGAKKKKKSKKKQIRHECLVVPLKVRTSDTSAATKRKTQRYIKKETMPRDIAIQIP